jgi:glycosyltransferase domain-containing protein
MRKKVAIIIPTKNRSKFLVELLKYYNEIECRHTIYIGDASNSKHVGIVLSVIKSLNNKINIVHKQYPEFCRGARDIGITVKKMLEVVEEEYVVYSGDDDYYIPRALDKCVDFLETNLDYSSVHGFGNFVKYDENIGKSIIGGRYYLNEYQGVSGAERLKIFINKSSNLLMSIHRKESFMRACRNMELLTATLFIELMPGSMSTTLGNSKRLNELYLIRGIHGARDVQPKLIENIIDPEWLNSLQIYIRTLSDEIKTVDGVDEESAKQIVKQGLSMYLKRSIEEAYCEGEALSRKNLGKRILGKMKKMVPLFVKNFAKKNIGLFINDKKLQESICYTSELLPEAEPYYNERMAILMSFNRIENVSLAE